MSTFARTTSGDFDFSSHALVVVTDVVQCAAWDIEDRFALGLGEWIFDTSQGVPYLSIFGVKNPSIPAIRLMFRDIVLSAPPVVSVTDSVQFTSRTRQFTYTFNAVCDTGQVISGGSNGVPFTVTALS